MVEAAPTPLGTPTRWHAGAATIDVTVQDARLAAWVTEVFTDLAFTDLTGAASEPSHRAAIVTVDDRYELMANGERIYGSINAANVVDHLVSFVNRSAIESRPRQVNLHSAGLVPPGSDHSILLPGVPGAGKSTLAAAALAAGWSYLSDEMVSLDTEGLVHGYPKPVTIKGGGTELVDIDLAALTISDPQTRWYVRPSALGADIVGSAHVHGLVFATYDSEGPTAATEMTAADALLALATNCQDELDGKGHALHMLADLASRTHRVRLIQHDVDEAVAALAAVAARPAPVPTEVATLAPPPRRGPGRGPRMAGDAIGIAVDGGVVVHHPPSELLVVLDPLAGAIWRLLDGSASERELAEDLADAFQQTVKTVTPDLRALLAQLEDNALVE